MSSLLAAALIALVWPAAGHGVTPKGRVTLRGTDGGSGLAIHVSKSAAGGSANLYCQGAAVARTRFHVHHGKLHGSNGSLQLRGKFIGRNEAKMTVALSGQVEITCGSSLLQFLGKRHARGPFPPPANSTNPGDLRVTIVCPPNGATNPVPADTAFQVSGSVTPVIAGAPVTIHYHQPLSNATYTQTVNTDGAGHYSATFTSDSVDHSAAGNSIDANLANGHSAACGFFER
ncbi:MAG: hypothetical protein QOD60_2261 [Solirubrobacterales bacterium]|nr:hypothetical protein [Solirubrobacterales bacterium]